MMNFESPWSVIKKTATKKMDAAFRECPQCFFSEHEIHSVLYSIAKEELKHHGINPEETTRDGYNTRLVHQEYPTPFRCDMQGYKFQRAGEEERTSKGGLYRRGHYDLVILNPDFVKNYTLDIVTGKNYKKLRSILPKLSVQLLIWACEIIYFPKIKKIPKNAIKIIEQDTLKIKETMNSDLCKIGSVHVFASHPYKKATHLEQQIAQLVDRQQIEITFTTG